MSRSVPAVISRTGAAASVLVVAAIVAATELLSLSLIDQIVLIGFVVVVPVVAGEFPWWWGAATATAGVAFLLPRCVGAVAAAPLVVASSALLVSRVRATGPRWRGDLSTAADVLALVYGLVAALALFVSRSGVILLDQHEPFVELTAVHYTFAGAGALYLSARCLDRRSRSQLARAGVLVTAIAPPVVALGFVLRAALPQVGGAVLMTIGVWITATLQLGDGFVLRSRRIVRVLLVLSGLAVWAPMILAVAWAAGQHWSVPMLSVHDMARTHGVVNALAFVVCGVVARRSDVDAAEAVDLHDTVAA